MIAQSHIPHNYKKSKFLQSQILQNCLEMTQQQHQLTCQRARCRSRSVKHFQHPPCHYKILRKLWIFEKVIPWQDDDDDGVDESSGDEEDKCPEGFEYNSVLNVCDDVDEVNL